jgi:outer membrane protein assembly factor BamB
VDLMSRSLAWAYPYREHMPASPPFATFQPQPFQRIQPSFASLNTATWRSAPPVIQDGKVVFTAPDADSVHCVNLRDGTFVWKKKQSENDLYLAGVYNGKVLIVGKTAVRALNLEDGRQLWYAPTGDLPSGQGVASQNVYYLPLKKGEIMALDIDSGRIKAHNRARAGGVSPGNLVFYDGTVISQTPMQIVAYPQLAARLELARANLEADPTNPSKLVDHGELLLANGQVRAAALELKKALAQKPDESLQGRASLKLYEALTDLLAVDFLGSSDLYLDEYRELCKVPDNLNEQQLRQARYFRIVGQGREAQGNLVEAFLMYREFGALPIHREHGGIASLDDPSHKVPTNVWLRGRVSAMIAKATPEQRAPLEKKIAEEWKTVEAKKDSDAIRSFVGMFDVPFAVGREARLQLADIITDTNDRPNFLEAELNLNQLRGAEYKSDPRSGGRALAALARLEEKKGSASSMKLAAAYYRELEREFANVPVRTEKNGARTGADLFNDMATDPRFRPYLEEPASPWENVKIGVRELPAGTVNGGPQGFIFQPEGDLTPLMKQHRLVLDPVNASSPQLRLIDLSTNTVRWTQTLGTVPQNYQYFQHLYTQGQANNHYFPNAKFRYFQVKGSLVVFQVGTMVYCLDADNARVLWQQSLLDAGNANQPVPPGVMVHQIFPDADGYLELTVSNPSNGQRTRAPIGHVGAVQASYVALATQKGLMVVDPIRGTLLWKKTDVPASTRVFGDENYIYLVETSEGSAGSGRVLRASDGMQIPAPDFGGIYQNRLKLSGRRILAAFPGRDGLVLKLHDIVSGKSIWSTTFDAKAMVLHTEDANLTGVIDPSGQVTILDVNTGAKLLHASVIHGRVTTEELKGLKDPLLIHDADRYYIALNKPIDPAKVARGILANNFSNGLRCGTVNGWFVALHRQAGERMVGDKTIRWKAGDVDWHTYAPLLNQLVVLEQFDQLPVILLSARFEELLNGGAGGNRWVSVTQSIDKRSGKMVFDPPRPKLTNSAAQFSAFQVDPKNGTITMIGFTGAIQHYIDDGRKLADAPGITLGGVQSTDPADGGNNPPARAMVPGGFGFPGPFPGDAPIRQRVIRIVPGPRD